MARKRDRLQPIAFELWANGRSSRQIARALALSRTTIRRYIREELDARRALLTPEASRLLMARSDEEKSLVMREAWAAFERLPPEARTKPQLLGVILEASRSQDRLHGLADAKVGQIGPPSPELPARGTG